MRRGDLELALSGRRHGHVAIDTESEHTVESLDYHQIRRILEGREGERERGSCACTCTVCMPYCTDEQAETVLSAVAYPLVPHDYSVCTCMYMYMYLGLDY